MRSFEILPHTADLRLKATGDSLEDLFHAALEGMAAVIKKNACKIGDMAVKKKISLNSADKTALLIDFLSEVLTVSQTEKVVFCEADFEKLSETGLSCEIKGTEVDKFDEDIKAVTYHEANVIRNTEGRWGTIVIFDI